MAALLILVAAVFVNIARSQTEPAACEPQTPPAKVAFVNLKKVLDESKQGRALREQLEGERDRAFEPLKRRSDELEALERRINTLTQEILSQGMVWDQYKKVEKQNELQSLYMNHSNLSNQLQLEKARVQEQLNTKKNEFLKPLEDKLNQVMEEIGKEGCYSVIMDVSPPAANFPNFNPIIYRNPELDLTDRVIAAVDK